MLFNQVLMEEKTRVEEEIRRVKKQLQKASGITLFARKSRGGYHYFTKPDDNPKQKYTYFPANSPQLSRLARETFFKKLLEDLEEQLKAIQAYMRVYKTNNKDMRHFLSGRSDALRANEAFTGFLYPEGTSDLLEWQSAPYERSSLHPEGLTIRVNDRLTVRSKSEAFIATSLITNQIPFHYEEVLSFHGQTVVPDFIILHPRTRKLIIWEHCGMMDSQEYTQRLANKLRLYAENGYIPDVNLILTFETADKPLDFALVMKKIEYFLK